MTDVTSLLRPQQAYAVYLAATGEIVRAGACVYESAELQAFNDGEAVVLETADATTQYVVDGQLQDRPLLSLELSKASATANGMDEITVSGIPMGAQAVLYGAGIVRRGQVDTGTLTITFAATGDYTLEIKAFPYQNYRETLHAI